jgi:methylenetetrahydrofolate dehydrogenase (NADP+)/methenyltetrahydrofolate cyclohydrolase
MAARIIDGRAAAAALRARTTGRLEALRRTTGVTPGLAVILVGDDPASAVYVRSKIEQSREAGFHSVTHRLAADATEASLQHLVSDLNADPSIHGVLLQLPLPPHLDPAPVLARLDPAKDVDGLTLASIGALAAGRPTFTPCTPLGCMMLLEDALGDLAGRRAVVLGRSALVGRPAALLLLQRDCTVSIAHSRSADIAALCREADILVAAVGRPGMVRGDWIRPGAAVIDVGINRIPDPDPGRAAAGRTRLVGDVAFDEAAEVAGWLTPVPGGVGPMTVACLLHNTLAAAARGRGIG